MWLVDDEPDTVFQALRVEILENHIVLENGNRTGLGFKPFLNTMYVGFINSLFTVLRVPFGCHVFDAFQGTDLFKL